MSQFLEPTWNKSIKESDGALDPLALNRVNLRMVGELFSGFTVTTQRARYYSFYVWAMEQINKKESVKNFREFENLFYDLERLYMLACIAHEEKYSENNHIAITGVDTGKEVWEESSDLISLNFSYYSKKLGGYEANYRGSIDNLELMSFEEGEFGMPSEIGKSITSDFEKLAKESKILTHLKKSKISKSELLKIGDKICLCKIKKQVDSEKNKIIELFFELNKHTNNSKKLRQKSLSLLLDVVKQIQKYKIIEPEDFLNACYFQEIEENKIKINNKFTDVVKKWKIIKAHDNFSLSSELALQAFLKFLEEEKNQSSEESFYKKCVSKMDDEINHILQTNEKFSEKPIQDIIHHILKQNNISTDSELYKQSMEFDELVKISSKINEQIFVKTLERLVKSKEIDVTKVITNSTLLVILTGLRFSSIVDSDDESIRWLKQKTRQDVGVIEFTKFVSEQIHQNVILKEFVKNFIKKFVIFQAEQTFRGKYNGKTNPKRWFRKEGTQYIKERSYESKHKNVRFEIAISLLDDLDLIDKTDKSIICTNDGEKILKKVTG